MVETEEAPEPLSVAKILKAIVEKEEVDLVILGKQSTILTTTRSDKCWLPCVTCRKGRLPVTRN